MLNTAAAKQLADKLIQYGCNVSDVDSDDDVVTAASVERWAECTYTHMDDFASDSEDMCFTVVELQAIAALASEIAALINMHNVLHKKAVVEEIYYDAISNAVICCFNSVPTQAVIAATIKAIEKAV